MKTILKAKKIKHAMVQEAPKKIGKIKSDDAKPTIKNGMKWAVDKRPNNVQTDRGQFGFKGR